ncbi:MAG: hypothetical protein EOM72_01715 [Opitutae bacterium]|nr:hypothetical protein [Opitutae bacterium]
MNKPIETARFALGLVLAAAPVGAETTDYTYDAAGRIAQAAYSSGANIGYAYDANGNLLNRQTSRPAGTNYTVATAWKTGGHITPVNPAVNAGDAQAFSVVASNGYVLADLLVNAVSVGPVTNYTFNNVRDHQSLLALFEPHAPPAPPPPFRFEEIRRVNDKLVVTLGWPPLPDTRYRLWWSTNLLGSFNVLASNLMVGEEGRFAFSVTNPIEWNKAFYHLEEE